MAAVTIRELLTKLGVKADTLAVQRFDKALGIAKGTMALAAGAALALTGALIGTAVATARQGDEAAKAGARVGVSAVEMQELGFAAEQTGASISDVEGLLKVQARTADEAAQGTGEAAKAYRRLGVNVRDASGKLKPQTQLLKELADGFRFRVTNDIERAALAQDVFGRSGLKMLPLLKQGSEGIEAFSKEAQDLGFVLDAEATKAAEDFTDAMNRTRKVFAGLRNQIGKQLLPVFTEMLDGFRDFVTANRDIIRARIGNAMGRIGNAIAFVRVQFQRANEIVEERLGGWDTIFQQIEKAAKLSGALTALGIFIKLVQAANLALLGLAANPVGLAVAIAALAVVVLGLAIDDLIVFANGGNSAIGAFLDAMDPDLAKEFRQALLDLSTAANEVASIFVTALNEIGIPVESLGDLFKTVFGQIILAEIKKVSAVVQGFTALLNLVPKALDAIGDAIAFVLERLDPFLGAIERVTGGGGVVGRVRAGAQFAVSERERLGGAQGFLEQQRLMSEFVGPLQPAMAAAAAAPIVVNQAGDTININGTDLSRTQIMEMMNEHATEKNRQAIAATRGGDR